MFLNLMHNAIDAMPDGGEIIVTGSIEADRVVLHLTDDGVGVDPDNQDRIMEPFFTTKEVGQGTGLGLSICYGIMQSRKLSFLHLEITGQITLQKHRSIL